IPLGPGIAKSEPFQSETGKVLTLAVETYNFSDKEGLEGYLRIDSFLLKANAIKQAEEALKINVDFDLPENVPVDAVQKEASLILIHPENGAAVLPAALFLNQKEINVEAGEQAWESDEALKGRDLVGGLHFPYRSILYETIRNTYYHVPMWFAM